jgi:hypothetical protein
MPDNKIYTVDQILTLLSKVKRNYSEVHLHHTYRPNKAMFNSSNHIKLQDGMRSYHMNTLKWRDIGQHLTIFPDGTFMVGRSFEENPASITGRNHLGFAIEMIGDFDVEALEGKQLESILKLINTICIVGKKELIFHNQFAPKTCPGKSINKKDLLDKAEKLTVEKPKPVTPPVVDKNAWKVMPLRQLIERNIIESDAWLSEPDSTIKAWQLAVVVNRAVDYILNQKGGN